MSTPCHALVFRDVKDRVSLAEGYLALTAELKHFLQARDDESFLNAFLRAAELETALMDNGEESSLLTALLSRALISQTNRQRFEAAELVLRFLKSPRANAEVVTSRPEGFAFYGLHPLDYVDALDGIEIPGTQPVVVIGIRSIGMPLGLVVVSALIQRCRADRPLQFLTVRPSGHPYERRCTFSPDQQHTILQSRRGRFLIVDEGPGLSGSSFLSIGEALIELGVRHEQITFLCSRKVDPQYLVTANAAARWNRFTSYTVERRHFSPAADAVAEGPRDYREAACKNETEWPGLWTSMLPARYRSADDEYIFEYHGLGRYGDAIRQRLNRFAVAGFTQVVARAKNGFSRGRLIPGRTLSRLDLSPQVLERMADYLACRVQTVAVPKDAVDEAGLEQMARFNFQEATGAELASDFHLPLQHPVIADAQMMPHTWLQPNDGGALLKLECGTHGDNHFYPGPVDIAWDLAGSVVEWRMSEEQRDYFIAHYNESANDNVNARLDPYITAYSAFRNAYCRMAASAMAHDPAEQARLLRDAERYRCVLAKQMRVPVAAAAAYE